MNIAFFKTLINFFLLLLVQVLVLNHVHLFGFATPLLYIYLVLMFQRNYPRWALLLWGFLMGLSIDVFSNTPGLSASSMTFLALVQPWVLNFFMQRDSADDLNPSVHSLGFMKFFWYTVILAVIYCVVFFTMETFNFFNWRQWLLSIGGSVVVTVIMVLVLDNFRRR